MTDYATGSQDEMEALQLDAQAQAGLPVQSDQSGPGYHAPRSLTPGSPGWSVWTANIKRHPTQAENAFPVPPAGPDRDALAARLADKLLAQAAARVLAAKPLTPDWTPADATAATGELTR
jgi:hypothetical protein